MRRSGFWLVLLLAAATPAFAQVTAEIRLDQDQFLIGESLPVAVRITNRSGQPLTLGTDPDWLTFSIESREAFIVSKDADPPVDGEFKLESSKTAVKRIDLAPYFSLNEAGRYAVVATIKIKNWDRQITTPPTGFNIIQGAKLWEQDFGVPAPARQTNGVPEIRKYILQQANFTRGRLRLYVRLTDEPGTKTFRVRAIGPLVSFSRVDPQIDKLSNLHLLFADGARTYNYSIINPDGEIITRQSFEFVDSRPRLSVTPEGSVSVFGGLRRLATTDLPAPTTPVNEAPKSKP